MAAKLAADTLVLLHLGFILYVALGALLVLKWRWTAWTHVPSVLWGVSIEFFGWICPLTPLENRLRMAAGEADYSGGFIDHYVMPVVYPAGLTRELQLVLGGLLLAGNLLIYSLVVIRQVRRRSATRDLD